MNEDIKMKLVSETQNRKVWKADNVFITGTDSTTACKYIVVDTVKGCVVLRTNSLAEALSHEVESNKSIESLIADSAMNYATGLRNPNPDFSRRPMDAVQREFNESVRRNGRRDLQITGDFSRRASMAGKFEEIAAQLS